MEAIKFFCGTGNIVHRMSVASYMLCALVTISLSSTSVARSVYLNGVDISTAKNQELRNVNIHINASGDLFIAAPHYEVSEQDNYTPLSHYYQKANTPVHQQPKVIKNPDSHAPKGFQAETTPSMGANSGDGQPTPIYNKTAPSTDRVQLSKREMQPGYSAETAQENGFLSNQQPGQEQVDKQGWNEDPANRSTPMSASDQTQNTNSNNEP